MLSASVTGMTFWLCYLLMIFLYARIQLLVYSLLYYYCLVLLTVENISNLRNNLDIYLSITASRNSALPILVLAAGGYDPS